MQGSLSHLLRCCGCCPCAYRVALCITGAFDGEDVTRIGYVSQFGNVSKQVVMTKTEGTTGMTGKHLSSWFEAQTVM